MTGHRDVLVIGSGPAGLSLAAACQRRGLSVGCIAPASGAQWTSRYGMWVDELEACDVAPSLSHRWDHVTVRLADRAPIDLGRSYAWIDNDATRARLLAILGSGGRIVASVPGDGVTVDDEGATVRAEDGRSWRCRVVIDAAGARSPWTRREAARRPGWQSAWGVTGRLAGDVDPDELRLMDFTEPFDAAPFDDGHGAGFLYALPLGDGRWFLEETSLVRPDPLPWDVLEARLAERMRRYGWRWVQRDDEVERCRIPMGGPLPVYGQGVVPFGAAAGLVHPATGYSVAHAMRLAGPMADAIVGGLEDGPKAARAAAWDVLWPRDRVRAWRLFTFGMRALEQWGHDATNAHFAAFFALDRADWSDWLAGRGSPADLRRTMWRVFGAASPAAKARLMRAGMGPNAPTLLAGLAGRGRVR